MAAETVPTIQMFLPPVVMISANGLISLALYNRLAAIVSRARMFHKERFDAFTKLSSISLEAQDHVEARHLRRRITVLDEQVHRVIRRAKLIRDGLLCMLTTVLAMLVSSLLLGFLPETGQTIARWVFVGGITAMIGGVVMAMIELRLALDPLRVEQRTMEPTEPPAM